MTSQKLTRNIDQTDVTINILKNRLKIDKEMTQSVETAHTQFLIFFKTGNSSRQERAQNTGNGTLVGKVSKNKMLGNSKNTY